MATTASTITTKDTEFFAAQAPEELLETYAGLVTTALWDRSPRQQDVFEAVSQEILKRMSK